MGKPNNIGVAAAVIGCIGIMYSVPFILRNNYSNITTKEGKLSGSQRQRGMYLSHGSHDVGTYKHPTKQRELAPGTVDFDEFLKQRGEKSSNSDE